MPDIMKYIVDETALEADPLGHLMQLEAWSEDMARTHARAEGVTLTPQHWEVIRFLREQYRQRGPAQPARAVQAALERRFGRGRKHLYTLFPGGPVAQGSRLAGLPPPRDALDPSFGSTH